MKSAAPPSTRAKLLRRLVLSGSLLLSLFASLQLPPAQAATCPNEALRETQTSEALPQGTIHLPACMALEMVSPPKKLSLPAYNPWFSLDGERISFRSPAALGETPGLQYFAGDHYVAGRGGSGWQTFSTSPPASAEIALGSTARGGPSAFAPDLGSWLALGSTREQGQVGVGRIYKGALDGSFAPFSPLLVTNDDGGTSAVQLAMISMEQPGASADISRTVLQLPGFSPFYFFLPGDPVGMVEPNSYVASDWEGTPSLELLTRDKDGAVHGGRCGARLGGGADSGRLISQGAVSAEGLRIHFTTRPAQPFDPEHPEDAPACSLANPLRIMQRVGPPGEAEIAPIAPELPAGDDHFQGASTDGTRVYFTTARQVTPADQDTGAECSKDPGQSSGCDLYLYDSTAPEGARVTLVSSGDGADVLSSITAISGDGSRAYFVAEGVLSDDANPEGATAIDGQPNLYLYEADTEQTSFIGTLVAGDQGSIWGSEGSFIGDAYAVPYHGSGDGDALVFASRASLTAGDDDGGHSDLFRYDAGAETLIRVSAAVEGGEDDGPFDVSVNANSANARGANLEEKGRFASEDGETIAFNTAAALVSGDEDGVADPYVWKGGELTTVDATVADDDIPTVSPTGEEIAFATSTQLLPQDRDPIKDIYAIRVDGGFPLAAEPTTCDPLSEGSCQGQPPTPSAFPAGATSTFQGPGNQSRPAKCRKGQIKRRGKCVSRKAKRAKRKAQRRKAAQRRRAADKRRTDR